MYYRIFAHIILADIHSILKSTWGYDAFRPMQEDIIQSILAGRDTLAIMPTGGGKSICFQVPALAKEGICLVITPLIALMKDQVENLKQKDVLALAIHSGMPYNEVKKTLNNAAYGNYKFLYVSPERLHTRLFKEYLHALPINLIAVDEAHCISQWGYDFRPMYLSIADIRPGKKNVPVLALTASATKLVQDDICEKLQFTNSNVFQQSYERANLSYSVLNTEVKINRLVDIINKVPGCGIVYCRSRKKTVEIATQLKQQQISADYYHAGLSHEIRNQRQEQWLTNTTRIMVCTNAFGMGIDKPGVRLVVHTDPPDCIENYYQEAGRAGRDGKKSYAVLLYRDNDLEDLEKLPDIQFPSPEDIKKVYQSLVNYLQLPAGLGEDRFFDFNMEDFISRFKHPPLLAMYAIKAMEQEGILSYNEQVFAPSRVVFTSSKNSIDRVEADFPTLEPYIKFLLRSYGGILDVPVAINENQLATILRKKKADAQQALMQLHQMSVINYTPQKESPQIQFLSARVVTENLYINMVNYNKRKEVLKTRVEAMIGYVENSKLCRAKIVAGYFNDFNTPACGICDNCIQLKKTALTNLEFEDLTKQIFSMLEHGAVTIKEVYKQLLPVSETKIWKVIQHYLQEELLETRSDEGEMKLYAKKKGQDKNPARF